jgi:mitochondrial import receptor subunit TOM40
MGNVQASESGVPPPGSQAPPPPQYDKNPGTVEDLHKDCKEVFPIPFEGAKLLIQKALSSTFQINHTLTMSNVMPSGYRFGATYIGTTNVISPQESYPVILGDIDPSGNLQSHIIHAPTERTRCKMMAQIQESKWKTLQLTTDYKGDNYTASLTLGNPDLFSGTGMGIAHYLQNVTKNLALGTELAYQAAPQIPGGHIGVLSVLGRYTGSDFTFSSSLSNSGALHACYYQKCSQDLSVGAELDTNIRMGESKATVGYKVDIPRAGLLFKGAVNSDWEVTAVVEKKLLPIPFTLALCGIINHPKNSFMMGAGLIVG